MKWKTFEDLRFNQPLFVGLFLESFCLNSFKIGIDLFFLLDHLGYHLQKNTLKKHIHNITTLSFVAKKNLKTPGYCCDFTWRSSSQHWRHRRFLLIKKGGLDMSNWESHLYVYKDINVYTYICIYIQYIYVYIYGSYNHTNMYMLYLELKTAIPYSFKPQNIFDLWNTNSVKSFEQNHPSPPAMKGLTLGAPLFAGSGPWKMPTGRP